MIMLAIYKNVRINLNINKKNIAFPIKILKKCLIDKFFKHKINIKIIYSSKKIDKSLNL